MKQIFSLLLFLALLINCNCKHIPSESAKKNSTKDIKDIVTENFSKVIIVAQDSKRCSGFFIEENIIVTASHCILDLDSENSFLEIKTSDGKESFAISLVNDKEKDVAFLVSGESGIPLELTENYSFGERLIAVGYPGYLNKFSSDGIIGFEVGYLKLVIKKEETDTKYIISDRYCF